MRKPLHHLLTLMALLLVAAFALPAKPASAAVVFSNTGDATSTSARDLDTYNYAVSFTVPAGGGYTLNSVSIWVEDAGFNDSATVRIFSNNAGVPGSQVTNGNLGNQSATNWQYLTYSASGGTALAGGTTYWVVVTGANSNLANSTSNPTGTFSFGEFRRQSTGGGAWNTNASARFALSIDASPATVSVTSINRANTNPTNAASVSWTVTFSGPVTTIAASNFSLTQSGGVSGASITGVTGSGNTRTVTASTGSGSGSLRLNLANATGMVPGVATALPYNGQTYTIDKTAPTVTINQAAAQADPTSISPINFTVVFSETVTGFSNADVTITGSAGGTKSVTVTGSGPTYNVAVSGMTTSGTVIASVAAGAAQDAAGNGSVASTSTDNTVQWNQPVAVSSINRANTNPTNAASVSWTVTFSGPVTTIAASNLSLTQSGGVSGASITSVTGSGNTRTVTANTGTGSGTLRLNLANATGMVPGVSTALPYSGQTYAIDKSAPTVFVTQTVSQSDPTSTSPITFGAFFTEDVTGFTGADVQLSGTAGATTVTVAAINASFYVVSVSGMTGSGTVSITIPAGAAQDAAGNGNTASINLDNTVTYNAPSVALTSIVRADASPTNAASVSWTVTFAGSVTGVSASNFSLVASGVSGASITGVTGSGSTRTVTASTGSGSGTLGLDMVNTTGTNPIVTGLPVSGEVYTVDKDAPAPTISSTLTSPTNSATIPVTVTFSKSVAAFAAGDVTVGNGALSNFAGSGAIYTFDVTPTADGPVTVDVAADVAADSVGNLNTAAPQFSITYDGTAPGAAISSTATSPTGTNPIPVTVTFDESVTGFDAANVVVGNGALSNFAGSGTLYSFDVTPAADGAVTVDVAAGVANDSAGNGNTAAAQFTITYDGTAATVTITSSEPDPTNSTLIPITVTFSEPVTGFDASAVLVGNGTLSGFAGSGAVYTFYVTPAGPGLITVEIGAGAAQDEAGVPSAVAGVFGITFNVGGLPKISLTLMNDGTDAVTTIPNPVPSATPVFTIASGGNAAVSVDARTGAFVYAFDPGAPLAVYLVTVQIESGGQAFEQLVEITLLPAPPPVPLCEDHNFDEGGVVRSGAINDAIAPFINCRVLYQYGASTTWLGSDMYSEANLGAPGLLDLGVLQAVDVFSPGGLTYFDGGAVFCLRGSGALIWMAGSQAPRHPEIVGSYTVPEFPGFTCVTLFEPGTLILVRDNPVD